tara:strand:+ start:395 stop:1042 length:648 start_codon:yes stop_codon:yes gene_type:complete
MINKKKNYLAFYGAGGCGRSLIPIAKEDYKNSIIIFVDDYNKSKKINGIQIINFKQLISLSLKNNVKVIVSIADNNARLKIVKKLKKNKLNCAQLISNKSTIMDYVKIGEGAVISPYVTLGSNVKIGKYFHANLYSYIEHDCEIGDFVTLAPGAKCNGNVKIEDNVFVGSGAIIINGNKKRKITIGKNAIIGAGTVIIKNVKANSKIVGNPGRYI